MNVLWSKQARFRKVDRVTEEAKEIILQHRVYTKGLQKFRLTMKMTSSRSLLVCVYVFWFLAVVSVSFSPDAASMEALKASLHFPDDMEWSNPDCCSWEGLKSDEHSQVTSLRISNSGISGSLPPELKNLQALTVFELVDTQITGIVPVSFTRLKSLRVVNLTNNLLQGPTPEFDATVQVDMRIGTNSFCLASPGASCDPRVSTLLSVIADFGYPIIFARVWKGNDPCRALWLGIDCSPNGNIKAIALVSMHLTGSISPRFADMTSLSLIDISRNRLTGSIPLELTSLKNLTILDVSDNCLQGKVPYFNSLVVKADGNPSLETNSHKRSRVVVVCVGFVVGLLVIGVLCLGCYLVIKMKRSNRLPGSNETTQPSGVEAENIMFPIQVLRDATDGFGDHNIIGRGSFGSVYKGRLPNGVEVAVKRMQQPIVSGKGIDEFRAEVSILTKVHHRNLVIMHGYCLDGNEKLLVYEFMRKGSLSKHLFHWNEEGLDPLEWSSRLTIALDVARGVEYLHTLAHQSYIHRDLKPSNILLGDDMQAKISDFGLVRPTFKGSESIRRTKCVGTPGYIAPEYTMTGSVSRKADVFSFGVILMELITGQQALDENRPEGDAHITVLFKRMLVDKDSFASVIDKSIAVNENFQGSIDKVAQLATHCSAKLPEHRPDMNYAVSVLASLTEGEWKPTEVEEETYREDVNEMVRRWQEDIELEEITEV